jgi:ribosome-associated toxin RatA of RatAB toxin-antitoxin module
VKELRGTAAVEVAATPAQCMALLEAVDRYPEWYPEVVQKVEVTERDAGGRPSKANARLHVVAGPVTRDFDLQMAVVSEPPGTIKLARISHGPSDQERFEVVWRVTEAVRTRIDVALDASLSVPRFLPLGGIGDGLAQGFVGAAARALERSG